MRDFYKISTAHVERYGGKALFEYVFNTSLYTAFYYTYPEHVWHPWRFDQKLPDGYWDRIENQRSFMDWLGKELAFKEVEDWYKLTSKNIEDNGGCTLLTEKYNDSTFQLLQAVYPEHKWNSNRFISRYWLDSI